MNIFNSLGSNYSFALLKKAFSASKGADKKLASFLQQKYKGKVQLLYKGRQALQLALMSLDLPEDTKVAITGFTCYAVYKAVVDACLKVYLLDIDQGLNFSAESLEKAASKDPGIKVVVIQNTLGYPADIEKIKKVCDKFRLTLIEDLAHCVGTKYKNGQEAGSAGDLVALSFSQDKMVDAVSGGALVSRKALSKMILKKISKDRQIIDQLYPFLTMLIRQTYPLWIGKGIHYLSKRLNILPKPLDTNLVDFYSLPNFNCQLALIALDELNKNLDHRRRIAKIYTEHLNKKLLISELVKSISRSSNLRFPILVKNRDQLINYLRFKGVYISDIWYDASIAPKRLMKNTDYKGECPKAEKISQIIVNLPTHENVFEKDAEKLSELINGFEV